MPSTGHYTQFFLTVLTGNTCKIELIHDALTEWSYSDEDNSFCHFLPTKSVKIP